MPFSDLPLSSEVLEAIAALGIAEPFPVQARAIPLVVAGRDLRVQAPTGSGKTLAFAAPLIDRLGISRRISGAPIRCLVLVPTRELAIQVGGVFQELARHLDRPRVIRVAHGGASVNTDMMGLRGGADVLVATPGRLLDLASRNAARLGALEFLVLDEADRMLDLGFREELGAILALLPARRQTLLFSATLTSAATSIAGLTLNNAYDILIDADGPASGAAKAEPDPDSNRSDIVELVHALGPEEKGPFLRRLIAENPAYQRILVFVSSTRRADNVARKLANNGLAAGVFHGGLSQAARTKALEAFRAGEARILVASDLASRGLDIEGLPCVVNYELPRSPLDYTHRIGRTGRAGSPGLAISLVSPEEEDQLQLIEKRLGRRLPRAP